MDVCVRFTRALGGSDNLKYSVFSGGGGAGGVFESIHTGMEAFGADGSEWTGTWTRYDVSV